MAITGVISRVIVVITHSRGLLTPLITTHEPPSSASAFGLNSCLGSGRWKVSGLGDGFGA